MIIIVIDKNNSFKSKHQFMSLLRFRREEPLILVPLVFVVPLILLVQLVPLVILIPLVPLMCLARLVNLVLPISQVPPVIIVVLLVCLVPLEWWLYQSVSLCHDSELLVNLTSVFLYQTQDGPGAFYPPGGHIQFYY